MPFFKDRCPLVQKNGKIIILNQFFHFSLGTLQWIVQSFGFGGISSFTKKWRFGNSKILNGGLKMTVFLQNFKVFPSFQD